MNLHCKSVALSMLVSITLNVKKAFLPPHTGRGWNKISKLVKTVLIFLTRGLSSAVCVCVGMSILRFSVWLK